MSDLLTFPAQPARQYLSRTRFEIVEELLSLAMSKHRLSTSLLAQDCLPSIKAQMIVLEEHLTGDDLHDRFEDDGHMVLSAAMDAADWLRGDDEYGPVSAHWRRVARKHSFTSTMITV